MAAASEYGDPALPERFWEKVFPEPNTGCWLWGNSEDGDGYAMFGIGPSRCRRAHIVAYGSLVGAVPAGLILDHLCRQRSCVNPSHLEPVTVEENNRRGLRGALRTHCKRGHRQSGKGRCPECRRFQNMSENRPARIRERNLKNGR